MKKIKSIAIAIIMMVAGTTIANAHEKKGPHGGQMTDANGYHIELLNKNGKLSVYLLDDKEKSISNKGITGNIILQLSDKTSATLELTVFGDDGFLVGNDKASTFTSCVVTFKVNGKTAIAKFKAESSIAKTYTCQMHHEVTRSMPGKCPKCGMDLVEKEANHEEGDGHHQH